MTEAGRQKVVYCDELAGYSVRLTNGTLVVFRPKGDEPGGVREPRRPKPTGPVNSEAVKVPA